MEEIVCCLGGCVCTVVCLVVTARAERSDSRRNRSWTGGREGGGGKGERERERGRKRERECACVCVRERERGGECNNHLSHTHKMHTF